MWSLIRDCLKGDSELEKWERGTRGSFTLRATRSAENLSNNPQPLPSALPPPLWEPPRYEKPDVKPEVFEAMAPDPEEVNWDDLEEQAAAYDPSHGAFLNLKTTEDKTGQTKLNVDFKDLLRLLQTLQKQYPASEEEASNKPLVPAPEDPMFPSDPTSLLIACVGFRPHPPPETVGASPLQMAMPRRFMKESL